MPRYFLELQYKGTEYHGWQIQHNGISVQQKLNEALSVFMASNIETLGCGRTDTGVHALQFFAQFDCLENIENAGKFIYHLNCILPADINLLALHNVNENVSARFDARSRSYIYLMHQHKNPFYKNLAAFIPKRLNLNIMNEAATELLRHNDFQCFSRTATQVKSFDCTITQTLFSIQNDLIRFDISANRFLRGMVRTIVGTLLMVGEERITPIQFKEIIESRDRRKAGQAVPPEGLYLSQVIYPFIEPVKRNFF